MQKRSLSKVMCVFMTAAMLTGCGSTQADTGSQNETTEVAETITEAADQGESNEEITGTITVLTNRTDLVDSKFADYAKTFQDKYPGTEVKFEAITDYEGDVAIRLQTEEYGDVLSIPNSIGNVDFPNFFEPLGTVDELKDKYKEQFLYAKYYDGQVYGLASTINAQGIVYNKRIWAEAGIEKLPVTPEEFLDDLALIKENTDAIPYYTNAAAGWPLTQWQDH